MAKVEDIALDKDYIPEEYHDNVRNFKYTSTNRSIVYKYITYDLSEYMVSFFPRTLA